MPAIAASGHSFIHATPIAPCVNPRMEIKEKASKLPSTRRHACSMKTGRRTKRPPARVSNTRERGSSSVAGSARSQNPSAPKILTPASVPRVSVAANLVGCQVPVRRRCINVAALLPPTGKVARYDDLSLQCHQNDGCPPSRKAHVCS